MRKKDASESWGLKIRGTPSDILGPTVYISMVVDDSVSHKAGLKRFDQLLEVNDVDTRKMKCAALRQSLSSLACI